VLTAIMLLCNVFISCGTQDTILTKEQIADLRKDYPTIEFNGSSTHADDIFSDDSSYKYSDVILRVEILSPMEIETTKMAVDAKQTFFDNVKFHYYRVKVNEVIAVNHNEITLGHKSKKENLDLKFPYKEIYLWYPDWCEPDLKLGSELVVLGAYSQERDSLPIFSVDSYTSFYLVDGEHMISMTSDAYIDKYSGYTYQSFRNNFIDFAKKYKW
jgi:hypothetical protein